MHRICVHVYTQACKHACMHAYALPYFHFLFYVSTYYTYPHYTHIAQTHTHTHKHTPKHTRKQTHTLTLNFSHG